MYENDQLKIQPIESYTAPKIPTFGEDNSAMLKKLPSRWKTNAKVLACIGIMGTVTLAGCLQNSTASNTQNTCDPTYNGQIDYAGYTQDELVLRMHTGGGGAGPFYVVHLTEQEALGIIRQRLEDAGLNFNFAIPDFTVDWEWGDWGPNLGVDLFDCERNVAVTNISWNDNNIPFFSHGGNWLADEAARIFEEQFGDVSFGVFFNPSRSLGMARDWIWHDDENWEEVVYDPPSAETKALAREFLVERLTFQTQAFIDRLRADGIIENNATVDTPEILQSDVAVTLNGAVIEFETPPIIVNDRTLVPMREIFEELGMQVSWFEQERSVFGWQSGGGFDSIQIFVGSRLAFVGNDIKTLDSPAIIHNERTFVPLRFIAEATGANVEWNNDTRTVEITN